MPKVYISERQRESDRCRREIKAFIKAKMAESDITQRDVAECLGCSQANVSQVIRNGSLSLLNMMQLNKILHFDEHDVLRLFGNKEGGHQHG